jgi:tetratricopeptide (TPR) repeat protein
MNNNSIFFRPKILILTLLVIWPIGIIPYWIKDKSKTYIKIFISVVCLAFWLIFCVIGYFISIPKEESLLGEAETCLEKKDTTGAYNYYTQAIKENPKYSLAYRRRGDLFQNQNKIDKALSDFNLSLEFETNDGLKGETYINKAECLIAQYRYREAIEFLNLGIALCPSELYYSNIKMSTQYKLSDYQSGIETANHILEVSPKDVPALTMRSVFKYNLKQYTGAMLDINRALQLSPSDGESYYMRGLIYDDIGEHEKGCQDFKKSSDLNFREGINKYKEHCN